MIPLIVIVGTTSSGKSALGMDVAKKINGEIICADSWTVYRGFDIGTAKPSLEERQIIRHHLLDVADPLIGFSAPEFQRLAKTAIEDVYSRGKIPIVVGGTGLYIDSILYDYSFLPPSIKSERDLLSAMSLRDLLELASNRKLDLNTIDIRNKRRVIRLIENNGIVPTKSTLRENTLIIGLADSGEILRTKIINRVDRMIAEGLEQEVLDLSRTYGWSVEPMKGIGYKEWRECIESNLIDIDEVKHLIVRNTIGLAKRQRTWFKRNKSIHWINNRDDNTYCDDLVTSFLNKH